MTDERETTIRNEADALAGLMITGSGEASVHLARLLQADDDQCLYGMHQNWRRRWVSRPARCTRPCSRQRMCWPVIDKAKRPSVKTGARQAGPCANPLTGQCAGGLPIF